MIKPPAGRRPQALTDALTADICVRIVDGETLSQIAADPPMPDTSTIYRALAQDEAFRQQYALAKEIQLHILAEEILEIADHATPGTIEQARREIEHRKRLMVKRIPKKHGGLVWPGQNIPERSA